jgi:Rrf2 family protein
MLSNTCKYGIRALIYLASKSGRNHKVGIKQIADDLKLPTPFLAKILQQLVKSKILISSKGPHGGFSFAKDPQNITLYDVILIIDGNSFFENCIIHNKTCQSADKENLLCPVHREFSEIRESIIRLFMSKTIHQLVDTAKNFPDVIL